MQRNKPRRSTVSSEKKIELKAFVAPKHPGSICVANYKGGVGKTTATCLLGYYLAQETKKKVLLFDIDPQCSLSLAVGLDPDDVSKKELTIYNLVMPSKWTKISKTNFSNYVLKVPDTLSPQNLYIVRGSFDVENLDIEITKSLLGGKRHVNELFLYCKQMLMAFEDFEYVIIDCPPNRMFLTQAMLGACSFYLPVTIPDAISVYGMPRLLKWVNKEIPKGSRPKLLGYILNALNRHGGRPSGKVVSQQTQEVGLGRIIQGELDEIEKGIIGADPQIGSIPRLDAIARFLNERGAKNARYLFSKKTSGQPTIDECLLGITKTILNRIGEYRA